MLNYNAIFYIHKNNLTSFYSLPILILSHYNINNILYTYIYIYIINLDRLCGLVVRVSGYRYRGPGFDPRRYQIF